MSPTPEARARNQPPLARLRACLTTGNRSSLDAMLAAFIGNRSRRSICAMVCLLHTSSLAWGQVGSEPPAEVRAGDAPAQEGVNAALRERARTAYAAGKSAYAAADHSAAAAHFALADSLIPAVQAKFWRAMSLDQLGNVPDAYDAFAAVLGAEDRAKLGAENQSTAEARHAALAATPADVAIATTPAGARVRVSGVEVGAATPTRVRLAAGRHRIEVSLTGYESQSVELQVRPGAKLTKSLTLTPVASPSTSLTAPAAGAAAAPMPTAERSRVPGYVTLGIAGASAVVGTIFGLRALSDKSDFDDAPTTSRADDVERNALIADMAFGVTLTLGITGLVLLLADDPMPEQVATRASQPSRLSMLPYVTRNGGGAAARLLF